MGESNYINRGGELVLAPPFKTDPVDFFGFILDADIDELTKVCDKYLNAPLDRVCENRRFVPAGGFVLLACINIPKMYSDSLPYKDWGWFKEQEIGFWVLVIDQDKEEMYWHMPYIWVDNPYAMAMGRELYGFPKGLGEINIAKPDNPDQFSVDTLLIEKFGADSEAVTKRLVKIEKKQGVTAQGFASEAIEELDELIENLFSLMQNPEIGGIQFIDLIINEWEDFRHKKMPMVFLKEFRDACKPKNNCYQFIIETKPTATNIQNIKIFDDTYDIDIFPCDSHPIISDLGLKTDANQKISTNISFYTQFNFEIATGAATPTKAKTKQKPKKLAVIGGGVGAMSAVFEITNRPDWHELYEGITVYQMGWRLGGKGASGRNQENDKIEEHGLHVWLGFYNNAFKVMQQAYQELGRKPGAPLATWTEAFKKHNNVVVAQKFQDEWYPWEFNFPENCEVPGKGDPLPSIWDYIVTTMNWVENTLFDSPHTPCNKAEVSSVKKEDAFGSIVGNFVKEVNTIFGSTQRTLETVMPEPARLALETVRLSLKTAPSPRIALEVANHALNITRSTLRSAQHAIKTASLSHLAIDIARIALEIASPLLEAHFKKISEHLHVMGKEANDYTEEQIKVLLELIVQLKELLYPALKGVIEHDLELRRVFILLDTGLTIVSGLIEDDVLFHEDKLGKLDDKDFREWLRHHDAEEITVNSPLVQALYDLVFAYENGEVSKPNFAAGTAIRVIFRIFLTYKGSIFWKMQAGMGDTVFTPLHQVLEKRGVQFKYFHKVKNLGVGTSTSGEKFIESISIGKQATIKNGNEYDPYVIVHDLACWPSTPNYDQLVEGDTLKNENINLESFYSTWQDVEEISLKAGEDFDQVLFGASLATIPYLCSELIDADKKWKETVEKVGTVRTMAYQAWLNKDLKELGWDKESPIMDAFIDPLNTWADMTHLIPHENWPASDHVKNIAYFCGPLEGGIPPASEKDEPQIALDKVKKESEQLVGENMKVFWPNINERQNIVSQYHRANIDPTERYVLSLKGSTKYRLDGQNSGFENLFLAGDWTICGINAGSVEAAVISGMLASNAMTGCPELDSIDGWEDII